VTILAAGLQKLVQPGLFRIGERRLVADQELVPARYRHQLALEHSDGLGQVVEGHRMLLARESLLKRRDILGMESTTANALFSFGMAISTGLRMGPLACSSTVGARPSQNCTKCPAAL